MVATSIPIANIISYTFESPVDKRLIGAGDVKKIYCKVVLSKTQRRTYWKHVRKSLEVESDYEEIISQTVSEIKKNFLPLYTDCLFLRNTNWEPFNKTNDIVVGINIGS